MIFYHMTYTLQRIDIHSVQCNIYGFFMLDMALVLVNKHEGHISVNRLRKIQARVLTLSHRTKHVLNADT